MKNAERRIFMGIKTHFEGNYWYWHVANVPVARLEGLLNNLGDKVEYVHNRRGELTMLKIKAMPWKVRTGNS
jgi:hypothetical protein